METRKVQLSGGTTYTISLPKAWAQEQGIESGSVLGLHPKGDGTLLVEPTWERAADERSLTIDVSVDDDQAIRERIRTAYTIGVGTITLLDRSGHPPDRRQLIAPTVAGLSGFEILETTPKRLRLTNLIDAQNVDVRKSTIRLRLVMQSMHRDAVTALTTDDPELATQVVERDDEADKLFAMITRHFRRSLSDLHEVEKLGRSRDELFEFYYTARQFERIADHAERIAGFAADPEAAVPEDYTDTVDDLGSAARSVVETAADAVLSGGGVDGAMAALQERDAVMERIESLDRTLYNHDDPAEAYALGLVLERFRRTAEYGANVAEVAIQQATRAELDSVDGE